jgi:hypothetical protein
VKDDECASGVCVEADGMCATAGDILYVAMDGADSSDCPKEAPCLTIAYAVSKAGGSRKIIKLLSGDVSSGPTPVILTSVVIDGNGTTIRGGTQTIFTASLSSQSVIEGVRMARTDQSTVVEVATNAKLTIADSVLDGSVARVESATLELLRTRIVNGGADCVNGNLSVLASDVDRGQVSTQLCKLDIKGSRIGPGNQSVLVLGGGLLTIENNVFTQVNETNDSVYLYNYSNGSSFRFNTVINSAQVPVSGHALFCGSTSVTLDVSSNIFAYNSAAPLSGCMPHHSLFDGPGVQAAALGPNNVVSERALFFRNQSTGDFHLAVTSPAIGIAEPSITVDHDGNVRPMPAGTKPDAGAYEAP